MFYINFNCLKSYSLLEMVRIKLGFWPELAGRPIAIYAEDKYSSLTDTHSKSISILYFCFYLGTPVIIIVVYSGLFLSSHYKYLSKNTEKLFGRVMTSGQETAIPKANILLIVVIHLKPRRSLVPR